MTLRELEASIQRRDAADGWRAETHLQRYPMLAFDRAVPEGFVGATLIPEAISGEEPLSRSRQREIERIVLNADGLNDTTPETYPDGVLFVRNFAPPEGAEVVDSARATRWSRRAYVGGDGHVEIRLTEHDTYERILLRVLCNIYALGSQIQLALGLGPRARGSLICHRPTAEHGATPLAGDGEFAFEVNFSMDSVVDMARRPLMYALRTAGTLTDPEDITPKIADYWRYAHSGIVGDDLSSHWR